ncbi:MAG: membrane protein insertase YidC [Bacteroidales bacterium]|nr:membrane protein insertase YidC [Bacteroidales bacterium]MDY6406666.1 membrane protein insertase YidC [Bacteroidales bacterium]
MDKNTWIGFLLIAGIIVGFSMLNRPSKAELAERQRQQDSIQAVRMEERKAQMKTAELTQQAQQAVAEPEELTETEVTNRLQEAYGPFAIAAQGEEEHVVLDNGKVRLTISTLGGVIKRAELPEYKASGDSINPLRLFGEGESKLDFTLRTINDRILQTANLYFTPVAVDSNRVVMRLKTNNEEAWLDFIYELSDNYMVSFIIAPHQLQTELAQNIRSLDVEWSQVVPQHEQGRKFEERYAQLQYMLVGGDIEKLSESKEDHEKESANVKWIGYKDQFFSTVFIADESFNSANFYSRPLPSSSGFVKQYSTSTSVPFDITGASTTGFRFYMGPNHYNTLKSYDEGVAKEDKLHLKSLVPLGWKIVSWINFIIVIPMFDLFTSWGLHIGWVILLMTLVIKLIILPFVFVSYKSSAKMRALKPQIDAINEKYPAEKMQERQQATMQLYQQAGVSPMSGCLPMLFQFPVLMAMFWFLPTAIELRGKSLFWADDLSTYDAVFHWGTNIPLLGDHLSLFCLLMTIANFGYTFITMQSQATDPNMKFMKYMMYAMPLMFLFIFNDYAAGLSFYYLVSLFITIIQTMIFRWALDDKKMLAEIEANKKKRAGKPKSGFMQRLEKMQQEQQRMARENAKKNIRR